MSKNEIAKATIYLDGKQAESALLGLKKRADELKQSLIEAKAAGNTVTMDKLKKEISNVESATRNLKKETFDYEHILKNLNGASLNDLKKALKTIEIQIGKMKHSDPGFDQMRLNAKALNAEIKKVNLSMKEQVSGTRRIADAFNNYQALAMGAIAAFAGISLAVKGAITGFNDYQDRVANLSALTGLAGEDLQWLSDQAHTLGTSVLDGGVLVTNGSQDIVDAFTKVGSARPELLATKEALVEVTKDAMILSSASKELLAPSIAALTMVMNQYNTSADESRRIVNVLAAGSKAGAGEIPYLTMAFEKAGTVAADAGLSIETLTATIETLAPRITAPEIAGRSLKGVLLKLQQGADDTNPAIVGMATALENLGKKNLSVTQLTKMLGTENVTTGKILIDNVGELRKYEAAVTGTNVALEQGAINTATNNAKIAQAKERFRQLSDELGGTLSPIYASVISKSSLLLKSIATIVKFLMTYGREVMAVVLGLTSYYIAVKIAANWTKIQTAYTITAGVVESAYGTIKGILTGKIKLATLAQKGWNIALKANPIGFIIGLIIGAVTWLIAFDQRTGKVSEALKKAGMYVIDLANSFIDLYNNSMPVRIAFNYLTASIKTGFAAAKLAVLQFFEPLKLVAKLVKAALSFDVQGIKDAFSDFGTNTKENVVNAAKTTADIWSSAYNESLNGKVNLFTGGHTGITAVADEESSGGPLGNKGSLPGTGTPVKDTEIDDTDLSGSGNSDKKGKTRDEQLKENSDKEIKILEENFVKRNALIEEQQIKEQDSEISFNLKKAVAEREHLEAKRATLAKYGQSTEEIDSIFRKQQLDLIKEDQDTLNQFSEDLNDAFQKQRDIDSEAEKAAIDAEVEKNLKLGEETQEFSDYVVDKFATTEDQKLAILKDKRKKGLVTELEYEKESTRIHEEAEEKKKDASEKRFETITQLTGMAANLVSSMMERELTLAGDNEEKKNAIRKKYAGIQFASAVASIIIDTAGAIMKGYQQLGPIFGTVAAVLMGATGLVQISNANAQKNQMLNGFSEGGYTAPGDTSQPAGIVHRGEWVAPKSMVKNPQYAPVISWLEKNRVSGNFSRVNIPPVNPSYSRGYASGGFVTPLQSEISNNSETDARYADALNRNTAAMQKILDWKPTVYTEMIKKDLDTLENIKNNSKL